MQTVIVQITNNKAIKLLQQLEDLHLIKLLKKNVTTSNGTKLSDKFAGKLNLTDEQYTQMQNSIAQSRNEWENNI